MVTEMVKILYIMNSDVILSGLISMLVDRFLFLLHVLLDNSILFFTLFSNYLNEIEILFSDFYQSIPTLGWHTKKMNLCNLPSDSMSLYFNKYRTIELIVYIYMWAISQDFGSYYIIE